MTIKFNSWRYHLNISSFMFYHYRVNLQNENVDQFILEIKQYKI